MLLWLLYEWWTKTVVWQCSTAAHGKAQDLQVPSARPPSHVLIPSMSRWRFGFLQTKGAISWLLPLKSRQQRGLGSGPRPIQKPHWSQAVRVGDSLVAIFGGSN